MKSYAESKDERANGERGKKREKGYAKMEDRCIDRRIREEERKIRKDASEKAREIARRKKKSEQKIESRSEQADDRASPLDVNCVSVRKSAWKR